MRGTRSSGNGRSSPGERERDALVVERPVASRAAQPRSRRATACRGPGAATGSASAARRRPRTSRPTRDSGVYPSRRSPTVHGSTRSRRYGFVSSGGCRIAAGFLRFFDGSYPALAAPLIARPYRRRHGRDTEPQSATADPSPAPARPPAPRAQRKPRAARARRAAAALSVAAMLSLGGVLAWHDGQVADHADRRPTKATTARRRQSRRARRLDVGAPPAPRAPSSSTSSTHVVGLDVVAGDHRRTRARAGADRWTRSPGTSPGRAASWPGR